MYSRISELAFVMTKNLIQTYAWTLLLVYFDGVGTYTSGLAIDGSLPRNTFRMSNDFAG